MYPQKIDHFYGMHYTLATCSLWALFQTSLSFTPPRFARHSKVTQRYAADPSVIQDLHYYVDGLNSVFSSITLSDAANIIGDASSSLQDTVFTLSEATTPVPILPAQEVAATSIVPVTAEAASNNNGWFGFLEGPIEYTLQGIHNVLVDIGLNEGAWGVTIIAMTTLIKVSTYPLTKQQLESTNKMQALQPMIKETQAKYASNPEVMNQKISQIYQKNDVNPLAGCVPSLLQIPIFIGLYRAVLTLAKDNKLDESFLFLPNLEGPTYGADPSHGSDWILTGWTNGAPLLGWEDTLAFLSIPLVLVVSQSVSMNLMASKDQDQPALLKFLPLMIGWFSLNVPAALGIYWVANNFITTALTLQIRRNLKASNPVSDVTNGDTSIMASATTTTPFNPAPIRAKPSGFAASESIVSEVTPITAMNAELIEVEDEQCNETIAASQPSRGKGKKKRGKKKNN